MGGFAGDEDDIVPIAVVDLVVTLVGTGEIFLQQGELFFIFPVVLVQVGGPAGIIQLVLFFPFGDQSLLAYLKQSFFFMPSE